MISDPKFEEYYRHLYSDRYWINEGEIWLPRHPKVYFVPGCVEFKDIDAHEKFIELGWCIWNGLDLYEYIKPLVDSKYEVSVTSTIIGYIEELRSGKKRYDSWNIITKSKIHGNPVRTLTLKEIVQLFSEELLLRYCPHRIVECYWNYDKLLQAYHNGTMNADELADKFYAPTPATEISISEEDILTANPWRGGYVENSTDFCLDSFNPKVKMLLKCDASYINQANEKNQGTDYEYILNRLPSIFCGNPLKAKVVVLSLNPSYDYRANHLLPMLMPPQLKEAVNYHKLQELRLEARSFMCERNRADSQTDTHFIDYRDAQNMLGNWYWYDILESFRKEAGLPKEGNKSDIIYDNLALIQYVGYASKKYKDLPTGAILPSQRFTKLLIHYLAKNKEDVLFVVFRSKKQWEKLIGKDFWNMLEEQGRLVYRKHPRSRDFNRDSFEGDGFDKIVNALNR